MTVCPYDPNAATQCFWNMAGDATELAVASVGFAVIALFVVLVVMRAVQRRRRRRRRW